MTTETTPAAPQPLPAVDQQIEHLGPRDIVVGLLTYNNAATAPAVVDAARSGLHAHFPGVAAAIVNADAGSSDGTPDLLARTDLPAVLGTHPAPLTERAAVPFHGIPGRGAALRLCMQAAQRLGSRVLVLLEADVTTVSEEWIARLVGPVWADKADLVMPGYARHRYDGTITFLLLAPLVRALYGRRLHQPLGGSFAMSTRLAEHLLLHPRWNWASREVSDLWITGTAIADGFSVWEGWLGRRRVQSRTRTTELPAMVAETLGAVFMLMEHHGDLWMQTRGSEPLPSVGQPTVPSVEPTPVDTDRMVGAFRLGLRDLGPIWEQILAPETMGEVLALDAADAGRLRFPDDVWARVVYDFALGHHYTVVHRDHLLRSLVPLYLGRTAAFVEATRHRDAAATEAAVEAVGAAFERQKPYLVERWR